MSRRLAGQGAWKILVQTLHARQCRDHSDEAIIPFGVPSCPLGSVLSLAHPPVRELLAALYEIHQRQGLLCALDAANGCFGHKSHLQWQDLHSMLPCPPSTISFARNPAVSSSTCDELPSPCWSRGEAIRGPWAKVKVKDKESGKTPQLRRGVETAAGLLMAKVQSAAEDWTEVLTTDDAAL
ncbi:hypothetical protein A9Z42_0020170 [Trichoderma parareesei]|uniref:Uncharacterized protein n=1 Tax=Trichoderma parareesei TaxID=858221 RepID=A0A2H2Z0T6_TRIPA|nr:hypothetical protein A9Z42_0020170 [Trichoderma parareesei]